VDTVHLELKEGTNWLFLSSIVTILCLEVLEELHVEEPLLDDETLFAVVLATFGGCGTNGAHTNCTLKTLENRLIAIEKQGGNGLAVISGTGAQPGILNLQCTIIGFPLNCDYLGQELTFPVEGAGHTEGAGNGRLIAEKTPAKITETLGGLFCPAESALDGELVSSDPVYITG